MTHAQRPCLAGLLLCALLVACSLPHLAPVKKTPAPPFTNTAAATASHATPPSATSSPTPTATASPTATSTPALTPTRTAIPLSVSVIKIPAPSLKNNLLNDADKQPIQVYLPPSYDRTTRRYPVVYFLPGFGSDSHGHNDYFSPADVGSRMANGQIQEMILVVPNGANVLHGSFYVNSPVTGNWEDYIVKDVIGYVDAHYRTLAGPSERAIGGHSMGGFGAFNLAMRHPDLFGMVYCLSPGLFDETGLADSQMFNTDNKIAAFIKRLEELKTLPKDEAIKEMASVEGGQGLAMAYGAVFAPDPAHGPPYFDYPYRLKDHQLQQLPAVWARWENGFGGWELKIKRYHSQLTSLKGIMIEYGTRDTMDWIPPGSEYLAKLLTNARIPNRITHFEGDHTDHLNERLLTVMLPFFSQLFPMN